MLSKISAGTNDNESIFHTSLPLPTFVRKGILQFLLLLRSYVLGNSAAMPTGGEEVEGGEGVRAMSHHPFPPSPTPYTSRSEIMLPSGLSLAHCTVQPAHRVHGPTTGSRVIMSFML